MYSMPPVASKCLLNGPVGNGRGTPGAGDQGPGTTTQHGTQGLIQLCVIVTKDESGYGLTVSGDKPVHVQVVKENGASARAGVRTGDRIYKVNGSPVANCDHTEVVKLIRAGSHVALTLLRKPEKDQARQSRVPVSPGAHSTVFSVKSSGSDKITHPIPADALQEQMVAKEKIETVRRMYEEALANENKLQQDYSKSKSQKAESRLQDAKKMTSTIRHQLESLTLTSTPDKRNVSSRNSICLGEFHSTAVDNIHPTVGAQRPLKASWSIAGPFSKRQPSSPRNFSRTRNMSVKRSNSDSMRKSRPLSQQLLPIALKRKLMMRKAVSMPNTVDYPDSSVLRPPAHSVIGETTPVSDDNDDEVSQRQSVSSEHRDSLCTPRPADIFSMEEEDFSPESQAFVKDHGPFMDFEQLRNRHAHCSVFLSFLISNGDPAPLLFILTSDIYVSGSIKDMKRWAYEIHSTFILKDAPLNVKMEEAIIETIDSTLKSSPVREELWKNIFRNAKMSALDDIKSALAAFREKRELGLGSLFGDGELKDVIDKTSEAKIVEKTLKFHYDKLVTDTLSTRSQALAYSLATVMKEWGVHKGNIDRQLSFAMKDNKGGIKDFFGGKFKNNKKEIKSHTFNPQIYCSTTFCEQCEGLIWGIGYQGYNCSNCDMNIHKDCLSQVGSCKKKKRGKGSTKHPAMRTVGSTSALGSALGVPHHQPTRSHSFGSTTTMPEDLKEVTSPATDEETEGHSVADLKRKFEAPVSPVTVDKPKPGVGRSESFRKESKKSGKDARRSHSDVDKDGGEKIITAIGRASSGSSMSSLSNRSDSSSTEKVNDVSVKATSIDEEVDSDLEVEDSLPPLDAVIKKELLRKMHPNQKKLQEVINELLYTEKSHVRNLKLLDLLFHRPMARASFCSKELVELVFPDISSLIDMHVQINNEMKEKMKEDPLVSIKHVAHILLNRLDGEAGEKMKEVCANFCRNHSYALNAIRDKRKRDPKLHELLTAAETNPMCRRLQFKDLMISQVHRLTKYPLLIDSMCNYTSPQSGERELLVKASKCSRQILDHVNLAVKDCENHHKLVALQKRLDTKPIQNSQNPLVADYKNLNLQDYKLVYDGALTWRMSTNRSKQIDLHVILLEEMLVLLQVQDDGRLVLKCQSPIATQSRDDSKFGHSPIITLNSMLVRQVATDKKAIFIINTSQLGPQIYDLVANSEQEKKRWFRSITDAADSQKKSASLRRPTRRAHVNKSKLTLTETSTDESPPEEKSNEVDVNSSAEPNITTNNNVRPETWSHSLLLEPSHESEPLGNSQGDRADAADEVSKFESSQEEGERDAKSLLVASISDTTLLKQFLSVSTQAAALNAAPSPTPILSSPGSASKQESSVTTAASTAYEQCNSVLNNLSRRLNCLLEVVEEQDNERARLQHQLKTAEQLLTEAPKDSVDSRPNSFVSNSSSSTSVGDAADSQPHAAPSDMSVAIKGNPPHHSAPSRADMTDSAHSSAAESDSDEEGTVYADSKEDFADVCKDNKHGVQRPESSLSNVSNALTDNTLVSADNLSDDVADHPTAKDDHIINVGNGDNTADNIPHIRVNSTSLSIGSDSDIENTNIDDVVTENASTNTLTGSEHTAAAMIVQEAMEAALDIMKAESANANETDLPAISSNNIDVNFVPLGAKTVGTRLLSDSDIDDSDETDALSVNSLD
ncbi:rho guanine nucleotide exchange factor 11-like isoform X4 [Watersipora subatra]|uniref:rho guanine nucleotide exchange factor 11-like isoform X4 n=1 Tax=Watersipora subatra TaxID=2589382 RepID=UPI00355BF1E9